MSYSSHFHQQLSNAKMTFVNDKKQAIQEGRTVSNIGPLNIERKPCGPLYLALFPFPFPFFITKNNSFGTKIQLDSTMDKV